MSVERLNEENYTHFGDYATDVARGNVIDAYPYFGYGKLDTGGAVTDALVQGQNGTGVIAVPDSAGVQMSVVSTSANDSAAGSGVRTITIEYLNANLDLSIEVLTLNGTTAVNTTATDIRWVQAIYGATFGAGNDAAGTVTISEGGTDYAQIDAGERCSYSSFRRVPRGKKLFLKSLYAGSASGTSAARVTIEFVTTKVDGLDQQETGLYYKMAGMSFQDNSATLPLDMPFPIEAGQIVGLVATGDKSAEITAGWMGWVE